MDNKIINICAIITFGAVIKLIMGNFTSCPQHTAANLIKHNRAD